VFGTFQCDTLRQDEEVITILMFGPEAGSGELLLDVPYRSMGGRSADQENRTQAISVLRIALGARDGFVARALQPPAPGTARGVALGVTEPFACLLIDLEIHARCPLCLLLHSRFNRNDRDAQRYITRSLASPRWSIAYSAVWSVPA
jgi:hypothetical protein